MNYGVVLLLLFLIVDMNRLMISLGMAFLKSSKTHYHQGEVDVKK